MNRNEARNILLALRDQTKPVRIEVEVGYGVTNLTLGEALDHWDLLTPDEPFKILTIIIGD